MVWKLDGLGRGEGKVAGNHVYQGSALRRTIAGEGGEAWPTNISDSYSKSATSDYLFPN